MSDPSNVRLHRPLSPHLQIYRKQITSVMSILHRLTGVVLTFGTLAIAAWLWSAAYAPETFSCLRALLKHSLGVAALIGWTASFFYHLFNGVRHLFWDTGKGFDLEEVTLTGVIALCFTFITTAAIWVILLGGRI